MKSKKIITWIMAGIMSFGVATMSTTGEASSHHRHDRDRYGVEINSSNRASAKLEERDRRIEEENRTHRKNLRKIKRENRNKNDYNFETAKENVRHDNALKKIRNAYKKYE